MNRNVLRKHTRTSTNYRTIFSELWHRQWDPRAGSYQLFSISIVVMVTPIYIRVKIHKTANFMVYQFKKESRIKGKIYSLLITFYFTMLYYFSALKVTYIYCI